MPAASHFEMLDVRPQNFESRLKDFIIFQTGFSLFHKKIKEILCSLFFIDLSKISNAMISK